MDYSIIYSKRKTLAIEIKIGGEIIVRAPKGIKKSKIDAFIKAKESWILKAQKQQIEKGNNEYHRELSKEEIAKLKTDAASYIPVRVKYYSQIMGLVPTSVKISSAQKRFGSCSAQNALNFSYRLMMYPVDAIDYVVVHELAHIKHHNHSRDFYNLIKKYMPDYKEREKKLRK